MLGQEKWVRTTAFAPAIAYLALSAVSFAGVSEGLLGHWKLDDGTGNSTAADSSGNDNTGTLTDMDPAIDWGTGKVEGALNFDGVDDRVTCGVSGMPAPDAPQTISFWLRYGTAPSGAQVCVGLAVPGSQGILCGFHTLDGPVELGAWRWGGPYLANTAVPAVGPWHHAAYTFDGTTHRLYVNGGLADSSTEAPQTTLPTETSLGGLPGGGEHFGGDLDDVRVYGRALGPVEIEELAGGIDRGLVAHWKLDDGAASATAADSSRNGNTGTLTNMDPSTDWVTGKIGGGLDFDGTDDHVVVGTTFDPPQQGTVAFWMKPNSIGTVQRILGGHDAWEVQIYADGTLCNQLFAAGVGGAESTSTMVAGQMYHVACTYDSSTKAMAMYLDGVEDATSTVADDDPGTFTLTIGDRTGSGQYFGGLLDDVRVYDRVLSLSEIVELASVPDSGLVAHWKLDDGTGSTTAADASGNGNTGTLTNMAPATDWGAGRLGGALHFDGVDDHVALPANANIARNLSALTIAAWINVESLPSVHSLIEISRGDSTTGSRAWLLLANSDEVKVGGRATDEATSSELATTDSPIATGVWSHVTGVIDFANDTLVIYVDGEERARNAAAGFLATSTPDTPSLLAAIGSEDNGSANNYHGLIDDLRVYDRALSPLQIKELAGGLDRGLLAYWKLDDGTGSSTAADASGNGNTGTLTAMDPAADWIAGEMGGALDLDGADDRVECGSGVDLVNKSFTVSAWARRSAPGTDDYICGLGTSVANQGLHFGFRGSNAFTFAFFGNDLNTSGTYTDADWHHWTGTYDASTNDRKVFRDGVLVASDVATADYQGSGAFTVGVAPNAGYFLGDVDDVRVYGRVLSEEEVVGLYRIGLAAGGGWFADRAYRVKIVIDSANVPADQTSVPVLFLLSNIASTHAFWTDVKDGGGDLVVTSADGSTRLALEVVSCDKAGEAGEIWFKGNLSSTEDTVFYLYYGNVKATQPARTDTHGSDNVWTNGYVGVYHLNQDPMAGAGAIKDSTAAPIDGTAFNMVAGDFVDGKVGKALNFSGNALPNAAYVRLPSTGTDKLSITGEYIALEAWVSRSGTTGQWMSAVARQVGFVSGDSYGMSLNSAGDAISLFAGSTVNGIAGSVPDATWTYVSAIRSANIMRVYANAVQRGENAAAIGSISTDLNDTTIGAQENDATADPSEQFKGMIDEVRISSIARDVNYFLTQYNMHMNQTTFWRPVGQQEAEGQWFDAAWPSRIRIVISASEVTADLSDFPVLYLLSRLDQDHGFWASAQTGGGDLAVTAADGVTRLALEVVSCDTSGKTGEIWFKGDLSSTEDTVFYLYYGNAVATQPPPGSAYGSQSVWGPEYRGVYHLEEDPTGPAPQMKDSTRFTNHGTTYNMAADSRVAGAMGGCLDFDRTTMEYIDIGNDDSLRILGNQVTLSAWAYQDEDAHLNGSRLISKSNDANSHDVYAVLAIEVSNRWAIRINNTMTTDDVSNGLNVWANVVATYDGGMKRLYADGSEIISEALTGNILDSTKNVCIGTRFNQSVTDRYWPGKIDEARICAVARSADWIATEHAMQSGQATFWGSPGAEEAVPPDGPSIAGVVAGDPDNSDGVLGDGDRLTLTFSAETNAESSAVPSGSYSGAQMDGFFSLSGLHSFGDGSYDLTWLTGWQLRIDVTTKGTANVAIGDELTVKAEAGIKTADGASRPSMSCGVVTGDWGAPSGDGLLGHYYQQDRALVDPPNHVRVDAVVDFADFPNPPAPGMSVDNNFSVRWTGRVLAPSAGTYTFITETDDGARLWVNGVSLVDYWGLGAAGRRTNTIDLAAGQKYSIVFEFQEDAGGEYAKLKWIPPSASEEVIPQGNLFSTTPPAIDSAAVTNAEVGVEYVYTFSASGRPAPEFRATGLPAWLAFDGADTISGTPQAGDLGPTGTITVTATNGVAPDATQQFEIQVWDISPPEGGILREWWIAYGGTDDSLLTSNSPPAPTDSEIVTSFQGPQDWQEDYGSRLRGYVYPPVDGAYTFRLVSDDNGQLWLSTDDSSANMALICEENSYRDYDDWSLASSPVTLQAGSRYYIEVVHKETTSLDHIRVGWDRPDAVQDRPIPGEYLSPWVPAAPTISTQPSDQTVAEGLDATFTCTATGEPTPGYQWYDVATGIMAGETASTLTITAVTASDDGRQFYCVASNGVAPEATSVTVTLTVPSVPTAPTITTEPTPQTVQAGQDATFTCAADGSPSPGYQWYEVGPGIMAGETSATLTLTAVAAADDGRQFYCVAANGVLPDATSVTVTLTVEYAPTITTQPVDTGVLEGEDATFTCTADGNPAPGYQWYEVGPGLMAGETSTTLTLAAVTLADDGRQFYCVAANGVTPDATSVTVILTVSALPAAPTITTEPTPQTVQAGQDATFTCAADGSPSPGYQWYDVSTGIMAGETSATLTLTAVTAADDGRQFYCVAANGVLPDATSVTVILTVEYAPTITTQPVDTGVLEGEDATFTCAADGNPAPGYQWYEVGPGIMAGETAATLTLTAVTLADDGRQFNCVASNGVAPDAPSVTVILTVSALPAAPTITSLPLAEAYIGVDYAYTVTADGAPSPSYSVSGLPAWLSFDGTATISGAPLAGDEGTTGTITVTAANGVPPDDTQQFQIAVGVLDAGLFAWWKLDETAGTTAADSTGNGNTGTLYQFPGDDSQWVSGKVGGALSFDGVDEHVDMGNACNLTKDFTIAAWVNPDDVAAERAIVAKVSDSLEKQYSLKLGASALQFNYETGGGNWQVAGGTVGTGTWQHVAATVDSLLMVRIYVDGAEVGSDTAPAETIASTDSLNIGRWAGTYNDRCFDGLIDDVRIYGKALLPSEIQALFDAGAAPVAPVILSVVADDPDDGDVSYGLDDTITVAFHIDTNRSMDTQTKSGADMDLLFDLSSDHSFGGTGDSYYLSWTDARTLVIRVDGVGPPSLAIGDTITILAAADILNAAGTSAPSISTSPPMTGDWGVSGPPGAFDMTAPADGSVNLGCMPTLEWEASSNVSTYALVLADNTDFTTPLVADSTITVTTYAVPAGTLATETTYYWKVTASNALGDTPASTGYFSFTTTAAPAVQVTEPSDSATITGKVTLTANATDDVSVATVEFYVDGVSVGAGRFTAGSTWELSWDSSSVVDTNYTVTAMATDGVGEHTISAGVTISVENNEDWDGDGYTNIEELKCGTDPSDAGSHPDGGIGGGTGGCVAFPFGGAAPLWLLLAGLAASRGRRVLQLFDREAGL